MREKTYICKDCKLEARFTSYEKARAAGWAYGHDNQSCWCPKCAPAHRKGAAKKANGKSLPEALVTNLHRVQLGIEDIDT